MFTVAQFFEKQQLRVLAVPSSWIRDGFLMWPKIPSNEKLDKLRTSGIEFHGAIKKIPVLAGKKYKSLEAAETAADSLLKQDVSDIETKRRILKQPKTKISDPRPLKDYNKIIQDISSSEKTLQIESNNQIQQGFAEFEETKPSRLPSKLTKEYISGSARIHNPDDPLLKQAIEPQKDHTTYNLLQSQPVSQIKLNSSNSPVPAKIIKSQTKITGPAINLLQNIDTGILEDLTSAVPINVLENQLIEPTLMTDDNIIYINTPTNCSETIRESDFSDAITMVPLKSEVTLRETLTILKTEVTAMRNEMTQLKSDITVSIRLAVEDCLEKSFQRFATILDMERKVASHVLCEVNIAEEHKLIDDEDDLINFNKKLASKQVREEYIKYFSKIIVPVAYYSKGDSACYLIVDCLFTRAFWNAFTWTGISRGTKSKRGFREFANVLQLLLAIVSVGDPTYTSIKLETFCKNRLFRYSKSRCSSKQLRKSTCRLTKKKKDEACSNSVEIDGHDDDDDFSDELIYNTASDPNQTELQPEVEVLISVDDC
ncbi:uncharacterized protein LOC131428960 [Malaya genurostris]|uniref:uncharacterized protein LOC131428960 n=1 Tax=Malaya genurostris TaxID=325434 RepID=UPI0026F40188|nr:uncharacterized protein LOC131428960 [Malaya genurostris]